MQSVLELAWGAANAEQSSEICLIIAKQQPICRFEPDGVDAERIMLREHQAVPPILQ